MFCAGLGAGLNEIISQRIPGKQSPHRTVRSRVIKMSECHTDLEIWRFDSMQGAHRRETILGKQGN